MEEELGNLLWCQGDRIAELFEAVNMVPLEAGFLPLVKVIGSQVLIRLLGE